MIAKGKWTALFTAAGILFPTAGAVADDDDPVALNIRMEWIEIPTMELWKILRESPPSAVDNSDLHGRLRAMVDKGEAELVDIARVRTRSAQRAKTENISELIYPTEFEPPGSLPLSLPPIDFSKVSPALDLPVAHDVRNVGTTMEVDPVLGDDGYTIDLNLAPEIVKVGRWGTGQRGFGMPLGAREPVFYTMRISTAVSIHGGDWGFLGATSPAGPKGGSDQSRKVLMFVRVDCGRDSPLPGTEEEEPRVVTVSFEWIDVELKSVAALLSKRGLEADSTGLMAEVDDLVIAGKARVRDIAIIRTRSEQRAKVEGIEELIYPTEFEPAEKWSDAVKAVPGTLEEIFERMRETPISTAYDVRNVGATLEIDPAIGADGHLVDLKAEPEIVGHHGDVWHGGVEGEEASKSGVPQPLIATMRASVSVQAFSSGKPVLCSVLTPRVREGDELKADPKWRTLVFARTFVSGSE